MGRKKKYNWKKVQQYYDAGNSLSDCIKKFGMAKKTLEVAKARGDLETRPQRLPIEYYTEKGWKISRSALKRRLIEDKYLKNECSNCGLQPEWMGKKLDMHIDHINGNRYDNSIDNLRLLCPNCDQIQDTFAGRNAKNPAYKELRKKREKKKQKSEKALKEIVRLTEEFDGYNLENDLIKKEETNE